MKIRHLTLFGLLAVAGCANENYAPVTGVATVDREPADLADCKAIVQQKFYDTAFSAELAGSLLGGLGVLIADASLPPDAMTSAKRPGAIRQCMVDRGYQQQAAR